MKLLSVLLVIVPCLIVDTVALWDHMHPQADTDSLDGKLQCVVEGFTGVCMSSCGEPYLPITGSGEELCPPPLTCCFIDTVCKIEYNGMCKKSCYRDEIETIPAQNCLCLYTDYKCCVNEDPCKNDYNGKCRNSCDDDENELKKDNLCIYGGKCCIAEPGIRCISQLDGYCTSGSCKANEKKCKEKDLCSKGDTCCVDQDTCKTEKLGECKTKCNDNELTPTDGGLCILGNEKCCVSDYPCRTQTGGVCRSSCWDWETDVPGKDLCFGSGKQCCVADNPCKTIMGGNCINKRNKCGKGEEELVGDGLCVNPGSEICCVPDCPCEEKLGGDCRSSCKSGQVEAPNFNFCTDKGKKCCVDKDEEPCEKKKGGKCKDSCDPKDEMPIPGFGLCLRSPNQHCCVDENPCETEKDGKCKPECGYGEVPVIPGQDLCIEKGCKCCIDEYPCKDRFDGVCKVNCDMDEFPLQGPLTCYNGFYNCCIKNKDK